MKTCVITENFSCDPTKVWLYLTKPTLNSWRKDVRDCENDGDQRMVEHHTDGSTTVLNFSRFEKHRSLSGSFQKGKISGTFTVILLGGGDSTSLECTMEIKGLGLFAKPKKLLQERMTMLHNALGA